MVSLPTDTMLKRRITKAVFDELNSALQAEYKQASGSADYVLDAEDGPSDELKTAKQRETAARQAAEKLLKEAQDRVTELEEAAGAASGGLDGPAVAKLKLEHKAALAKAKQESDDAAAATSKKVEATVLEETALRIASDISTVPDLLAPKIRERLMLTEVDGRYTVQVKGEDGTASEMKLEALSEEFVANEKFSTIITGSKASGASGAGGSKGGRAPAKTLSEMTATEEATFANEKPVEYERMIAAESGAV